MENETTREERGEEEVIRWEELTPEQKKFVLLVWLRAYILALAFWTRWLLLKPEDWKQWWEGLKAAAKELKTRLSDRYELVMKIAKLLFFLFQFIYPLVLFLLDIEDLSYNITCLVVGFIGIVKDGWETLTEIDERRKQNKTKKQIEEQESTTGATTNQRKVEINVSTADEAEKEFRKRFKDVCLDLFEEVLIYPAIICDVFGFVNGEVYKFKRGTDYVDTILLIYGIALDLIDKQIRRIILLYRTWKALCDAYPSTQTRGSCVLCCGNGFVPWFIVQFAFLAVVHFFMIAVVGFRCFYDNREEHDYTTTPESRFLIAAALCLPLVSIIMYVLMNKVWMVEMFIEIKRQKNKSYKNRRLEFIAKKGCWKKTKAPFADIKAVIFGAAWISMIAYAAYASELSNRFNYVTLVLSIFDSDTESTNLNATSSANSTEKISTSATPPENTRNSTNPTSKNIDNIVVANDVARIAVAAALICANPQTVFYSIYVSLILAVIAAILTPLVLICIFAPFLLIIYCFYICFICLKTKDCHNKFYSFIKQFIEALWISLIT
ncbi:uncharacterized protein LOC134184875 [Corticium candelabrum]|uniref:uncharacterized protein LOC134184875 n=1 Tax=Corticium candelabrum TaxID=121492 RepID=UPI002E30BDDD|nr:uncharacterized protein LOC134184875 [Corticium candelabrum]